jgi:subtilase family serine protease
VFEQGYYNPADVDVYFRKFNIGKNTKQTAISVDGSPIAFESAVEDEACLDLDMLVGLNPYIAEVKVYIDDYQYDPFPVAMVDAFQAMADDTNPAQVLSISYGQDEGLFGASAEAAEDTILQQLASEGISVFAASGDNGAYGNEYYYPYNVPCPASDPYITSVGGTTLFTQPSGYYLSEAAWNEFPNFGATGGGVSVYWPIPDYQYTTEDEPGSGYMQNDGGSLTYRNVPDVGAIADPLTGVAIYVKDQGGWLQIGGTSVACPVWAGYLSNVDAALKSAGINSIGFFNPFLYSLGEARFGFGDSVEYLQPVDTGSNGSVIYFGTPGFSNGPFYNNTTGNGSIWGGSLAINILTSGTQSGSAPGSLVVKTPKPTTTTCRIVWTPSSNAGGYIVSLELPAGVTGPQFQSVLLAYGTPANQTSFDLSGLKPNTQYLGAVFAYNASGASLNSFQFQTPK